MGIHLRLIHSTGIHSVSLLLFATDQMNIHSILSWVTEITLDSNTENRYGKKHKEMLQHQQAVLPIRHHTLHFLQVPINIIVSRSYTKSNLTVGKIWLFPFEFEANHIVKPHIDSVFVVSTYQLNLKQLPHVHHGWPRSFLL